ncbi:proteasomal ubiquitin receptor ADRM1-like isoform X1 [Centruroides sculpturatus]|uniref:proteasomal ubiquitin receptor ADRM1-like isoform X1 n=1 Tax=Centruroides sculpturatus TaxID=218467 RepID=UPI000C6D5DD3|nr:proteasomal ubiquitin receptor ADRM1-like isoform X1 [Centruroides sculpturatus]
MSRSFLFGGNSSLQSQNKYLVEFRAGKMSMKGNMVYPDKRKGLVYIHQTEDCLMHFCWKDRKTGLVEDDLIIFPDDVEFKKVAQCTTGRVFVLKFKSSSRKCFYWMQEPKTDKDDEYCSKVNEYLNNPPPLGSNRNGGNSLGSGGSSQSSSLQSEINNLTQNDIQNLLNNMSQQQLMQLLGSVGGVGGMPNFNELLGGSRPTSSQSNISTTESAPETTVSTTPSVTVTTVSSNTATSVTTSAPSTATTESNPSHIQLSDLQNILSGLNVPTSKEGSVHTSIDLSSALTAETLQPLFENQELMERLRSLLPTPLESSAGQESSVVGETLRSTIQSPQFQQALSMFSAALQSGQLGPLMQQFGMAQEVVDAANSGDLEGFVKALQKANEKKQAGEKKKNDKDDDEEMSLD